MHVIYSISIMRLTAKCQGPEYLLLTRLHKLWKGPNITKKQFCLMLSVISEMETHAET